jgi:thymidylate kinase
MRIGGIPVKTITADMFTNRKFVDEEIKKLFKEYKAAKEKIYVLEICGSPNSGKTSAIQAMDKILRQSNIKTKIIYEAASKCKIKDKLSMEFNIWTINYMTNAILEALNNTYDIVICERGFFDTLCWIEFHTQYNKMKNDYYDVFVKYFGNDQWLSKMDLVYVLTCTPEVSIKREYLDGLTTVSGTIVNFDVLSMYEKAIKVETEKTRVKNIFTLDTSDLDQISINRSVITAVLDDLKI